MAKTVPFRRTLPFRLLIASIILLALPLLVDSFIIIEATYQDAIYDAKAHLMETAQRREVPISMLQPARKTLLYTLEYFLNLREKFPQSPDKELESSLKKMVEASYFSSVFVVKLEEGKTPIVGSSDPSLLGQDLSTIFVMENIHSPAIYRKGDFNFVSYNLKTEEPYFISGRVVLSKDNKPEGLLIATWNLKNNLPELLKPDKRLYPVHFAILLDNTIVFAAEDQSLIFQYFTPIENHSNENIRKQEEVFHKKLPPEPIHIKWIGYPFFQFKWNGVKQVGFFENVSHAEIILLAYASWKDIFAKPFVDFLDIYGIYFLILFFGSIIAYLLTRRMSRPMNNLSRVMSEIQSGNLAVRYKNDPLGYEINELGSVFNDMVNSLLQKKALVEEERVKRETYSRELRIGQQVQRSLLPEKMPDFPSAELAARFIPAKQVGGDFYDVFTKSSDGKEKLVLTVADASGKGVQACFYSLGVRSMLRTYVREYDDISLVMQKTNALFASDTGDSGMFVTAIMAIFDPEKETLDYYSSGHNPPLLRRKDGEVSWLDHVGGALGIEESSTKAARSIALHKGDIVLFYSDGITEAHDDKFHLFSEDRLFKFLSEQEGKTPDEVADSLMYVLNEFVGSAPQHDDITLLIMKVKE